MTFFISLYMYYCTDGEKIPTVLQLIAVVILVVKMMYCQFMDDTFLKITYFESIY